MRNLSGTAATVIVGVALYFTFVWGHDGLRVLTSPSYGLDDAWRSQFIFAIGSIFGLSPIGLIKLAAFFGAVKLAVAAFCAVHILDRMRAIELLLDQHPEWKGRFTFVQVAAPTRSKLASYAALQAEAVALAEAINHRHGSAGYQPVRLLIRHHEPTEVFELFRAADLCIVSSLHDGMNLVAKEFVAARDDDEGVLVLSSFTGASREMSEALIVNPYDGQQMAAGLDRALRMPRKEQRERMRLMRQQVREQNVYRWAGRMLVDAARVRQKRRILDIAALPG